MAEKKVFDAYAAYYDVLYADKDYAAEAGYVSDLLKRHGEHVNSILDLGCGTGNHALELHHLGYRVTGVDLSATMIEQAKQRVDLANCAEQLKFYQGDMRDFRTEQQFDAVLALFHVMSYQTANADIQAALKTVYAHLKPGGVFIFDCWYGPGVLTDPPVTRIKRMAGDGFQVTRLAEAQLYANENRVDVLYEIQVETDTGLEKINECHAMRYLFIPEIELLLQAQGLQILSAESWLDGQEADQNTWNICVVAKK